MAVIQEKASDQEKASTLMRGVAEEVTERFDHASVYLEDLQSAITINDEAMRNISASTESTGSGRDVFFYPNRSGSCRTGH